MALKCSIKLGHQLLDNGLTPIWHQGMIQIYVNYSSMKPCWTILKRNFLWFTNIVWQIYFPICHLWRGHHPGPGVNDLLCRETGDLTHWGRVTHICVGNLTIIDSDNGLSPGRRQAVIWTSAGIVLIRSIVTNFSEILSDIQTFLFKKSNLKISSGKWRPFCLGLNVLRQQCIAWS